jgi:hypothetical protein
VRALTMKACSALAKSDAVAQRISQQQLATALLRWVILRDPDLQAHLQEPGAPAVPIEDAEE